MKYRFKNRLDSVLIVDDEPYEADWLREYFENRSFRVEHALNLQEGLDILDTTRFAYVVIDLSIPVSPSLQQPLTALGPEFFRYPGLMLARRARSTGHNTYQVLVYSVHDSDEVETYTKKIQCGYILKGRPRSLKDVIEGTITRKPHGWKGPGGSSRTKRAGHRRT